MRIVGIAILCVLAGCAGGPTLEELEDEAIVSGDWSAVEQREKIMVRKRKHDGPECESGLTSTCYEVGLKMECGCVQGGGGRIKTQ